jgi:hypothetical protein
MLVPNRLLLNREYNVINVLEALVSTVSMCSLHAIVMEDYIRYFTVFTKGILRPFNVRRDSIGLSLMYTCRAYNISARATKK